MVNARSKCNAGSTRLDWYLEGGAAACADHCRYVEGCEYFMFDPNDGECLQSFTTGINCPEGITPSNWYDFWAIDGGSSDANADSGTAPTTGGVGEGSSQVERLA